MEGIQIPPDLLSEFRNQSGDFSEPGGNGAAPAGASKQAILSLEKSLGWLIGVADDFAKERQLPGIGKLSNSELAELTTIALERNLGESFMQNSLEFLLGTIATGIVTTNLIAMKRQQLKPEKSKDDKEEK